MGKPTVVQRVAALEKEVSQLRAALEAGPPKKDWRSTLGMFSGDELMKEVDEEARKIREADRARARKRYARRPSGKSKAIR